MFYIVMIFFKLLVQSLPLFLCEKIEQNILAAASFFLVLFASTEAEGFKV